MTYRAKARKTFIADVGSDRVESHCNHIDSQIELKAINKQGLVKVPLHNYVFSFEREGKIAHLLK
jgi:hypothetical protein